MDLSYSPEDRAFQDEIRAFLAEALPARLSDKVRTGAELTKADMEAWHAILNAKGWLATTWPKEFGGPGWTPVQRHIFEEECCRAFAPRVVPFGLNMLGPVLMRFGTPAQQQAYLPRILSGADWWCQGYSEPGAGSDLASLRTRAIRDGDTYVVNGQKTWTTLGQHANRIFCLVRTSTEGKPQQGISFLLIDLAAPGIEMRPIRLIEGGHEVNEVFFTDVRVPITNRVGAENEGWTIAKFLLGHERTNIAGVGFAVQAFEQLRAFARRPRGNGRRLIDDLLFAARLSEIEIELEAMKITNLRLLVAAQQTGAPGPESSMLKIKGTQIRQALNDLARRALGPAAAPFPLEALEGNAALVPLDQAANAARYFNSRKLSIFGGSNEIQRNILAKAKLGL
ncbi:MAG: acyl-CoA dehydrogenase family protein [Rhodobacter sp.]|nr:acyl-CoA dehydrogenase family protein [Rhodobacter sp.]